MHQPDATPDYRKGLSTTLAIAALTGATVVALTLPVANADPTTPPPPPPGNTISEGPPPPEAPAPPPPPRGACTAPTGRPQRATASARRSQRAAASACRSQRAGAAPTSAAGAGPRRQRRWRLQLCGACGLEGGRRDPAVLRAGTTQQDSGGSRPAQRPTRAAAKRHQRAARPARPEAVRRSRDRQHQGGPAAGVGHGRVLHAVPRHAHQSGDRPAQTRAA